MRKENFTIRTMIPAELDIAMQWAEREGWNPGLHDVECFYAADPGGFFIGLLDDLPVACVSAVRYGADFGFMGFYMVEPGYRHRGYGLELARAGLRHLDGRVIGLDGVVEQQDNYHKSGFDRAHRNIRYRGIGGQAPGADIDVVPLSQIPFDAIALYDRELFPAERNSFLRTWINQPDATALGLTHGGALRGYGVIRACREGHKIGPLFADSPGQAEQLFRALAASVAPGERIYLDIPETNIAADELVRRHNMTQVFETARMYRGGIPNLPLEKIYGITTFELG